MLLLGVFSIAALMLAVIGIYGVLAYSVGGATAGDGNPPGTWSETRGHSAVDRAAGIFTDAAGIGIGLIAALLLTRLMSSMLYQVGVYDATTFVLTPMVFLGIALLASYLPARRATKVAPAEVVARS